MPTLEERVSELESWIRGMLGRELQLKQSALEPWWKRRTGAFENNSLYDDAMRYA